MIRLKYYLITYGFSDGDVLIVAFHEVGIMVKCLCDLYRDFSFQLELRCDSSQPEVFSGFFIINNKQRAGQGTERDVQLQ